MKYFFSLLLLISFISCTDDEPAVYQTEDDIVQYLDDNGITATKTDTGLFYTITADGNGKTISENSKITFSYKAYLTDGSVIEESDSEGFETTLAYLISGLSEGLSYFEEGSEGTLFIHPELGYGYTDINNVDAGSILIFDIEILKVTESEEEILEYLETNNLEAEKSETGLYYIVEEEGEGDDITSESIVTVAYTGYLLDGTEFDSSDADGVQFSLTNLIPGFTEGLTYFKEEGKGKLLIPSELAYGTTGSGTIPPNAVIIFDIEVITLH